MVFATLNSSVLFICEQSLHCSVVSGHYCWLFVHSGLSNPNLWGWYCRGNGRLGYFGMSPHLSCLCSHLCSPSLSLSVISVELLVVGLVLQGKWKVGVFWDVSPSFLSVFSSVFSIPVAFCDFCGILSAVPVSSVLLLLVLCLQFLSPQCSCYWYSVCSSCLLSAPVTRVSLSFPRCSCLLFFLFFSPPIFP